MEAVSRVGKRGPKSRPTNLKVLNGERPSRVNDNEPLPAAGEVSPPDWLRTEAVEVWNTLAPDLEDKGVLTPWDVEAFAILCDAIVQYRQASKLVAQAGVLIKGRRDAAVKNPAMQIIRDTSQTIRAYAQEFGLTPSSRQGVNIAEEADGLDAARLLT